MSLTAFAFLVCAGFGSASANYFPKTFNANDTLVALIDFQAGLADSANTTGPPSIIKRNVVTWTRIAKAFNVPVILVTALENESQGPLIPELQNVAPVEFANRIKRTGIINSWDDPNFVNAVRRTYRWNVIMAGITTEIGVTLPSISMAKVGYNVKVLADVGGSETMVAEQLARARMQNAGVEVTTFGAMVAELVKDSSTPAGNVCSLM